MSSNSAAESQLSSASDAGISRRRPGIGILIVLFIVVWIAVVTAVAIPVLQGKPLSWSTLVSTGLGILTAILIIIGIAIAVYLARVARGGPADREYRRDRGRRYERHHRMDVPSERDPAVDVARERFARGEISQAQLDEIVNKLGKGA